MSRTSIYLIVMFNAFCYVCYISVSYLHFTYYNAMQEALHLTNTQIGFIGTGCGIMGVIGLFVGGPLADIFPAKKMLLWGHLFSATLTLIFTTMPPYTYVFIIMVTSSFLLNGIFWNATAKMVRDFSTDKNEAKMYGLYLFFVGVGGTIFGTIGAYLIGRLGSIDGLITIFYLIAGYLVLAAVITLIFYKKPSNANNKVSENEKFKLIYVSEILKNRKFWLLSASLTMLYPIGLAISYLAPLLHTNYGVSVALVSIVGTIRIYIARIIFAPLGGVLVQKTSSIFVIKCVLGISMLCSLLIVLLPMDSSMLIASVIIVLVFAICYNTSTTTWYTSVTDIGIPAHMKGTAIGLSCGIMFHTDIYLYLICGMLLDAYEPHFAYRVIYIMTSLMFLAGLVFATLLGRKIKADKMKAASGSVVA